MYAIFLLYMKSYVQHPPPAIPVELHHHEPKAVFTCQGIGKHVAVTYTLF